MPWRPMLLRDAKVYAKCDANGELAVTSGRVEIRYKKGASKSYSAGTSNLSPSTDAALVDDAEFAASTESAEPSKSSGAKTTKKSGEQMAVAPLLAAGSVVAFADGACSGNPGPAGLGVVVMHNKDRRELSEYLGTGTNNIAELTAILRVAELYAGEKEDVHVFTDSSYSIGVLQKGWKAKANVELIADTKAAIKKAGNVTLHYVPGHAGVALNERADELARQAVKSRGVTGWVTISSWIQST